MTAIHTPSGVLSGLPTCPMTNTELLDALLKRRQWARALDRANTAEHKRREKAYLDRFRARLREAMKWDYAKVKANYGELRTSRNETPSCPVSVLAQLDAQITVAKKRAELAPTAKLTLSAANGTVWALTYWLLFFNEDAAPATVC